jgi:hypothetical protein
VEPTEGLENANAELQDWAEPQGVEWAMHGDQWDARYESYLSDSQTEPDPPAGGPTSCICSRTERAGRPGRDGRLGDGDVPEWPKGAAC